MAPNGIPFAPTVGIVPGTVIGEAMGAAGARRVFAGLPWATAVVQPNKTRTNSVRSKRGIKASCADIKVCRRLAVYF
jgi:hypothetical protein